MLLKNTDSFMYKIEAENVYEDWEFLKSFLNRIEFLCLLTMIKKIYLKMDIVGDNILVNLHWPWTNNYIKY